MEEENEEKDLEALVKQVSEEESVLEDSQEDKENKVKLEKPSKDSEEGVENLDEYYILKEKEKENYGI